MLYSIHWKRLPFVRGDDPHIIRVQTTFLDESGQIVQTIRQYEEWVGVCTNHIDKVIHLLQQYFPNKPIRHELLGCARKILPYFESRLQSGKLDYPSKPFYKLYIPVALADVGKCIHRFKVSYYSREDWLVRLYIDLCTRHDTRGFYYKWYTVKEFPWLLESFQMHPELLQPPDWTIGAFDLETVPMDGSHHVPDGLEPTDEIVMISLYTWNQRNGVRPYLLYRLPCEMPPLDVEHTRAFQTEREMLVAFHHLLQDCHVLTGYNINGFDFPCLFARLVWLEMNSIIRHYSSLSLGQVVVTTYQHKMVLDLYHYFRVFSNYNLPGFKLDDVARAKLGETKVPIQATGLWSWYTCPDVTPSLVTLGPVEECHRILQPHRIPLHQFGTFREYMAYCLKDSFIVYRLFQDEMVLSFLVERANFTAWSAEQALYMGNSSFLLELFKTYGTRLGFFLNTRFMKSPVNLSKYTTKFVSKTYQGALNYCIPEKAYEDISVMDFTSMYPSTLLSSNLCYGTCTILTRQEWLECPRAKELVCIPYRVHGEADFATDRFHPHSFQYPSPETDDFIIVINPKAEAFLPRIVQHFIELRIHHQGQYKKTQDVYHYNVQLGIKILINSLYGVMANKDSCLAYVPIAMIIVTLARYQLLGSYHYLTRLGYHVCYADTDSLMVEKWPSDECGMINRYLNLPHVELKYEQRMVRLLVLSRKRYVYETQGGKIVTKGFQKRTNELIEFISKLVLDNVWSFIFNTPLPQEKIPMAHENIVSHAWLENGLSPESRGWLLWTEIIQKVWYKCRDVQKYSIVRKTKHLSEYKSQSCVAVRLLEKYPEKANDYVEYTYTRADVACREASKWVVDVHDCQWVNVEQMMMSQKRMFCLLLNVAYWKRNVVPMQECDMVLNAFRWKQFVHAELLYYHTHRRKITMLMEKGIKYTFCINNHIKKTRGSVVRKRKLKDN